MDVHKDKKSNTEHTNAMIQALENTGIRLFMYFPQTKSITVPEKTCAAYQCRPFYANMPDSFAEDYVYIDDYPEFKEMYYRIDRGEKTATATFHSKDLNYCNQVTLTTVAWTEDGKPQEAFGIIENFSEVYKSQQMVRKLENKIARKAKDDSVQEAVSLIADAISDSYDMIYHIWLENKTYVCFQEAATKYSNSNGNRVPCSRDHVELYISEMVTPEYQSSLREFLDLDSMAQRLKDKDHMSLVFYRVEQGWTKGQLIAAKRDSQGNVTNVIYTLRDVNDAVKQEEKKKKTIFELQHDPLTNVYNRKGFEELIKASKNNKKPIGFAIMDIDHFKALNDTYGHEAGDQVLKRVAVGLDECFRNEDSIIRLGGDEFAIILNECRPNTWSSFCHKQEFLHRSLHEQFPQMNDITFSMGLCFSENGYYDEMYALADEALYETKRNGRSGCTLIETDHVIKKRWRDEHFAPQTEDTKTIEKKDDSTLLIKALNNVYFASYYLNLENNTYFTYQFSPGAENLQMQDKSIPEIFDDFIQKLVAPADRDKMIKFANMDDLSQRLGTEKSISCEYRSLALHKWCRARLIPVKYDKNGKLTHVLFTISAMDAIKGKELDATDYNKKSLETLFNHVPGGVVMYEWDGTHLKTLHISECYDKQYGFSLVNPDGENPGGPDFTRVHPDDVSELRKAVLEALTKTHKLSHTYRIWNNEANRYLWVRSDAAVSPQPEGISFMYVLYTDVTEQKEAELSSQKKQASLEKALEVSDQICFEYDPATHTIECLVEDNFLKLPKIITNYPDSIREYHFIHPQDMEQYLKAARAVNGSNTAHCDVRCLKDGEYRWFSCSFFPYYDPEKGRNVAICTMHDNTLRMEMMKSYEDRLRTLLAVRENALSMCIINVTRNTFQMVSSEGVMEQFVDENEALETVMMNVVDRIIGEESKNAYRRLMSREYLLSEAAKGNMHVQIEYLVKLEEKHYEWVMAVVDMIQNPVNGEIGGVAYSKSTQSKHMTKLLLGKTLKQDYVFGAAVFVDTDEFYLYRSEGDGYQPRKMDFWKVALKMAARYLSEENRTQIEQILVKEKVLKYLENNPEYKYAFETMLAGTVSRLEIRISFLDETHTMLLASMRDITDSALMKKFRYESEHDSLTGLYNRRKFIEKSEDMMLRNPETEFAIVHIDIKNFHRYNTFFGETAGDRLLSDLADVVREINEEYEYSAYGRVDADVFCEMVPFDQSLYETHVKYVLRKLYNYRDDFLVEPKIGIYRIQDKSMPVESMITRSSMAAVMVNSSSPFSTVFYDKNMEKKMLEEQEIVNEMQAAIEKEQFVVYLQAKYALRTGKLVGAEALVRWQHPEKGLISPAKFIPVFEGNGFIMTLDRYMWEHVCMLLCRWKKEGKTLTPISVNVSRISIFNPTTVSFLKNLVEKYGIEPKYFELELTESAYVQNQEEIRPRLLELQKYGFKILMDDFGSGYSSLNSLADLPVDILKLDMKFMSSMADSKKRDVVVSSIIRMSKLLNLAVIAEGVEKKDQADYLTSIGCEYVQGYLYAKPISAEEFEEKTLPLAKEHKENEEENLRSSDNCQTMLSSSKELVMIGETLAIPLMLVEYGKRGFHCLRANSAWIDTFGQKEENRPFSQLFCEKLPKEDHDRLIRAYEACTETNHTLHFHLHWSDETNYLHEYLACVNYEGKIGLYKVLSVTLMQEDAEKLFE